MRRGRRDLLRGGEGARGGLDQRVLLSGAGCCLLVRWEGASEGALGDFGWVEMGEGAGVGILV